MNGSFDGSYISNDEKLKFDKLHDVALDTYFLGLIDKTAQFLPKVVKINNVRFDVNSDAFNDFVLDLRKLSPEFNYAVYQLAKFKVSFSANVGEYLSIKVDLMDYLETIMKLSSEDEINRITHDSLIWRNDLNKQAQANKEKSISDTSNHVAQIKSAKPLSWNTDDNVSDLSVRVDEINETAILKPDEHNELVVTPEAKSSEDETPEDINNIDPIMEDEDDEDDNYAEHDDKIDNQLATIMHGALSFLDRHKNDTPEELDKAGIKTTISDEG